MCSPPLPRCGCRGHHRGWGALAAWPRQRDACSDVAGGFTEPWGPPFRATLLWVAGVLSAGVGFVVGCGWWLRWWCPPGGARSVRQVTAAVGCGGGCARAVTEVAGGAAKPRPNPRQGRVGVCAPGADGDCGVWAPQLAAAVHPRGGAGHRPPAPAGQQPEPPNRRRRHPPPRPPPEGWRGSDALWGAAKPRPINPAHSPAARGTRRPPVPAPRQGATRGAQPRQRPTVPPGRPLRGQARARPGRRTRARQPAARRAPGDRPNTRGTEGHLRQGQGAAKSGEPVAGRWWVTVGGS